MYYGAQNQTLHKYQVRQLLTWSAFGDYNEIKFRKKSCWRLAWKIRVIPVSVLCVLVSVIHLAMPINGLISLLGWCGLHYTERSTQDLLQATAISTSGKSGHQRLPYRGDRPILIKPGHQRLPLRRNGPVIIICVRGREELTQAPLTTETNRSGPIYSESLTNVFINFPDGDYMSINLTYILWSVCFKPASSVGAVRCNALDHI